jgi:hypothetical protein
VALVLAGVVGPVPAAGHADPVDPYHDANTQVSVAVRRAPQIIGELVVYRNGRLDFTALQLRIHPSAMHAARRGAVTPGTSGRSRALPHHELPVEDGAVGQLFDETGDHLREVAGERTRLAGLEQRSLRGAEGDERLVD